MISLETSCNLKRKIYNPLKSYDNENKKKVKHYKQENTKLKKILLDYKNKLNRSETIFKNEQIEKHKLYNTQIELVL